MKAIIIADNDLVIDNVRQVLKSRSYDTIVYRWLLKALDNLEEIAPHLIVVSQADYPRHWKTITQFAQSGISGFFPQVILYVKDDFSDDEREKAEALGVRGFFSSVDVEGLDELREILDKEDDIYSGEEVKVVEEKKAKEPIIEEPVAEEPVMDEPSSEEPVAEDSVAQEEAIVDEPMIEEPVAQESAIEESIAEEPIAQEEPATDDTIPEEPEIDSEPASEESASEGIVDDYVSPFGKIDYETIFDDDAGDGYEHISFMFTNPITGSIVTGTTSQFNGSSMEFLPDFGEATEGLELGKEIPFCSMKRGNEVKDVCAQVTDRTADGLVLFIKDK